jgi:DNA-binding beta-propeller fold protein YncE
MTMRGRLAAGVCAALVLGTAACSIIAGKDEPAGEADARQPLHVAYVETLRDQASLRGESFVDTKYPIDKAEAAMMLQRPVGVFADQFRVYVTELLPVPRLAVFDRGASTLTFLQILPVPGQVESRFVDPVSVAVDQTGLIYVADSAQGKVFGIDRKGALFVTIGKAAGELGLPAAVAADARRNRLYIADKSTRRVRAYTTQGAPLFEFQGPDPKKQEKGLASPVGIAVDANGAVFVLDDRWNRVYQFDENGMFLRSFRVRPAGRGGAVRPNGIAVDSAGHVYVSDAQNSIVMIFGRDGSFLQSWGGTGSRREDFWQPAGIFIDSRDLIYIADQMNGRIQVYQYQK